jgi:hypothetical protein
MAVLLNKADLLSEEQIGELVAWYTANCRAEQVRWCVWWMGWWVCGLVCVCVAGVRNTSRAKINPSADPLWPPKTTPQQVFVGSALSGDDPGVTAIKAWAVEKLPEGPTLYPKV